MPPPHLDPSQLLEQTRWARTLALALVRDPFAADDIAQDALTLALEHPEQPHPRAWLAGVVRNLVAQRRRQEARRARREREAAKPESGHDLAKTLGKIEAQQRLIDNVLALSERNRNVILWRYFEGETPRTIAAREGCTVASVSNQLTRAHAALRERLEGEGGQGTWLGALIPLLGGEVALKGAAQGSTALVATRPAVAALAWAGKAALLIIAPLALVWAGIESLRGQDLGALNVPAILATDHDGAPGQVSGDMEPVAITGQRPDRELPMSQGAPSTSASNSPLASARLQAQLVGSGGEPIAGAKLELQGRGCESLDTRTNELGLATWEEVPAGVPIAVAMVLDKERWPEPVVRFELEPDADQLVTWVVHRKAVISGIALSETGAPLAGQSIQLIEDQRQGPRLALRYDPASWRAGVVTDGAGRFAFPPQPPGDYSLFPDINGDFTRRSSKSDHPQPDPSTPQVAPCPSRVHVPFNVERVSAEVTFYTEGRIYGQAVTKDEGAPLPGVAKIKLRSLLNQSSLVLTTDESGAFVSPPLPPGEFVLIGTRGADGWCAGDPVVAERGATDVAVGFARAAAVEVRVEFAPGVQPVDGHVLITPPYGKGTVLTHRLLSVSADRPTVKDRTLPPVEYGFFFMANDGSCAGIAGPMALGAGTLPGGVVIHALPASEVRVANISPESQALARYYINGVCCDSVRIEPGGTQSLLGPPGTITLRASTLDGENHTDVKLSVPSGGTVSVEVAPSDAGDPVLGRWRTMPVRSGPRPQPSEDSFRRD